MLRKLGEKVGDFLFSKKNKKSGRKSEVAVLYDKYLMRGNEKEDALRRAISKVRESKKSFQKEVH